MPTSTTGLLLPERVPLSIWDLPPAHPLKAELGDHLATYHAGVWWVTEQQQRLILRSRNIQRRLKKDLGITTEDPGPAPLSPFER